MRASEGCDASEPEPPDRRRDSIGQDHATPPDQRADQRDDQRDGADHEQGIRILSGAEHAQARELVTAQQVLGVLLHKEQERRRGGQPPPQPGDAGIDRIRPSIAV